jgi:hypothetical protein
VIVEYVLILLVFGSRQVPVVVPNPPLSLEECKQLGNDAETANYFSGTRTKYLRSGGEVMTSSPAAPHTMTQPQIEDLVRLLRARADGQTRVYGHDDKLFDYRVADALASLSARHDTLERQLAEADAVIDYRWKVYAGFCHVSEQFEVWAREADARHNARQAALAIPAPGET